MAIILLDENFYTLRTPENIDYLDKLLDFLKNYMTVNVGIFAPYQNLGLSLCGANSHSNIVKAIQKRGNFELLDSNLVQDDEISPMMAGLFSKKFYNQIMHVLNITDAVIIPTNILNHCHNQKKATDFIFFMNHVYQELDSNFSSWVSENQYVKNINIPTTQHPLPNVEICKDYTSLLKTSVRGQNNNTKNGIFSQIGKEVLLRNSYQYDSRISSINSNPGQRRKIYKTKERKPLYASIDFENGSIEICDSKGEHIDEFGYDNVPHNKHDSTGGHDIILRR